MIEAILGGILAVACAVSFVLMWGMVCHRG
jgi:hypothetical protein